jgi:hypothetical protein
VALRTSLPERVDALLEPLGERDEPAVGSRRAVEEQGKPGEVVTHGGLVRL